MGGPGSGLWPRLNSKRTTDSLPKVDLRFFNKKGLLYPGASGRIFWLHGKEPAGSVEFHIYTDHLQLYHSIDTSSQRAKAVHQTVFFGATRCHFGGERTWFLCPACGRRVVALYRGRERFKCRICSNLNYPTQHQRTFGRLILKAKKSRMKLGDTKDIIADIPEKPLNMHWKTYFRNLDKLNEIKGAFFQHYTEILKISQ